MPTNRRPKKRATRWRVTPEIAETYRRMKSPATACTCIGPVAWIHDRECDGCKRWKDLHSRLLDQLQLKPWEYPAVGRRGGPVTWPLPGGPELWRALEAACVPA